MEKNPSYKRKKTSRPKKAASPRRNVLRKPHHKIPFPQPGNMVYPATAVQVTCMDPVTREPNVFTAGWAANVCTNPPMVSVSIRKERYSYDMIRKSGEFTINLTTKDLARAADYCGVRSGRTTNKFQDMGLTIDPGLSIQAPSIRESPVSIECRVSQIIPLGSHDMFLGEVQAVLADEHYMDEKETFHLEDADLLSYVHGNYYTLGKNVGHFGWSIRKKK